MGAAVTRSPGSVYLLVAVYPWLPFMAAWKPSKHQQRCFDYGFMKLSAQGRRLRKRGAWRRFSKRVGWADTAPYRDSSFKTRLRRRGLTRRYLRKPFRQMRMEVKGGGGVGWGGGDLEVILKGLAQWIKVELLCPCRHRRSHVQRQPVAGEDREVRPAEREIKKKPTKTHQQCWSGPTRRPKIVSADQYLQNIRVYRSNPPLPPPPQFGF